MYQKTRFLHKYLIISIYIDFLRFCFPFFCIRWLMGYHLLPTNPIGNADDFRTDTVGVQHPAKMGRCLGEVADTLSDGAFLRSDALLRKIAIFYNSLYINHNILPI